MNKVILMGRLTADPEIKYLQGDEPVAVVRFSIAVNKKYKREGEPDADFINCVAFGKTAEFTSKYFKKGMMISVVGRLQVRNWEDKNGQKRFTTEVVIEEQYFAESKAAFESRRSNAPKQSPEPTETQSDGVYNVEEDVDDDDLPF